MRYSFVRFLKILILSLASGSILSGCYGDPASKGGSFFISDIRALCDSSVIPGCNTAGRIIYIGLSAKLDIDCETYLYQIDAGDFFLHFTASGQTSATLNNGHLEGFVTSWRDSSGKSVNSTPQRSYKACAYIDINNNQLLDSGIDIFGEAVVSMNVTYDEITAWFPAQ